MIAIIESECRIARSLAALAYNAVIVERQKRKMEPKLNSNLETESEKKNRELTSFGR